MTCNWLVIAVTGITGGGKSELCSFMYKNLPNTTRIIRQDNYFLPVDSPQHVKYANHCAHFNWDIITALDMKSMFQEAQTIVSNPATEAEKEDIFYTNMVINTVKTECVRDLTKMEASNHPLVTHIGNLTLAESLTGSGGCSRSSESDFTLGRSEVSNEAQKCENLVSCRPVLVLDGFNLLDAAPLLELCDQVFFFQLEKAECFARRETRSFDPPDIPGYFDDCVWPMFEDYKERCLERYGKQVQIEYLDGAGDQKSIHRSVLKSVKEVANIC